MIKIQPIKIVLLIIIISTSLHGQAQLYHEGFNFKVGYVNPDFDFTIHGSNLQYNVYPSSDGKFMRIADTNLTYYQYETKSNSRALRLYGSNSNNYELLTIPTSLTEDSVIYLSFLIRIYDTSNFNNLSYNSRAFLYPLRQIWNYDSNSYSFEPAYSLSKDSINNKINLMLINRIIGAGLPNKLKTHFDLFNLELNKTYLMIGCRKKCGLWDSVYFWINPSRNGQNKPFYVGASQNDFQMFLNTRYLVIASEEKSVLNMCIDEVKASNSWKALWGKPEIFKINQINKINANTGLPDSLGVPARIIGVIAGFNRENNGTEFLLTDETGGITIRHPSKKFGLNLKQGDLVEAWGEIGSKRGLLTLELDSLVLLDSNQVLPNPQVYHNLSEETENKIVTVRYLSPLNMSGYGPVWLPGDYLYKTPIGDTITLQIHSNSNLVNRFVASTPFHLTGIGIQESSSQSAPFANNGYKILPRNTSDMVFAQNPLEGFSLLGPVNNTTINVAGQTNSFVEFIWQPTSHDIYGVSANYQLLIDTIFGTFNPPRYFSPYNPNATATQMQVSFGQLSNSLKLNAGQTFYGKWRVRAYASGYSRLSNEELNITFIRGVFNNLDDIAKNDKLIVIYPNPAKTHFNISGLPEGSSIEVQNMMGKTVLIETNYNGEAIPLNNLPAGLYLVKLTFVDGSNTVLRIVIE